MKLWLDQHISPQLAPWVVRNFGVETVHVRDLTLARAKDREIFDAARKADAVVLTKDADFVTPRKVRATAPAYLAHVRQYIERESEADSASQFATVDRGN